MLIDTHCHLNFKVFEKDFDKVIKRALANNVWIINVGSNYQTSKKALEIAQKYPEGVSASIGLHPIHLKTGLVKIKPDLAETEAEDEEFDFRKYKDLARSEKVKAIGEAGLDYYWKPKTKRKLELFKEKQKELLLKQLDLARELNLPVIFHCRQAHDDLFEVVNFKFQTTNPKQIPNSNDQNSKLRGVVHCFTGNWQQAEKFLAMGFYLGFNGIIFKLDLDGIIKKTPLERILIETDCPYLVPPGAGKERNEPIFLKYIAQKIAEIKKLSFEKVAEITTQSAKKLFKI